jgi:hypothetical protein
MMPVADLSGHCKATEESGSFYTRGVLWVGHVTDKSLGHVTGRMEKELYLPLYKGYISGSCDLLPLYQWVM